MKRNRFYYLLYLIMTVLAGLATRRFPHLFPQWVEKYGGDTLWAFMVFLLVGLIFRERDTRWVAISALMFSFAIEISQLYHASWIDSLRAHPLGGLVLGFGFLWSDMVCYTAGVGLGYVLEKLFFKR